MGSITRSFANNITTSGVLLPASLTNNSIANVTAYNAAVATGNMVLLSTQTASNSASLSFTTDINSTYKEYQFWFVNVRPASDIVNFQFNGSTDSGSNYNVTKTTTVIETFNAENGADYGLRYGSSEDLAQSTAYQNIAYSVGNDADQVCDGIIQLFNPASTTYVKHFICNANSAQSNNYFFNSMTAGYFNTTSAVNAINFKFSSGNISAGTILMYGIV